MIDKSDFEAHERTLGSTYRFLSTQAEYTRLRVSEGMAWGAKTLEHLAAAAAALTGSLDDAPALSTECASIARRLRDLGEDIGTFSCTSETDRPPVTCQIASEPVPDPGFPGF
jgi:hypothetical protein